MDSLVYEIMSDINHNQAFARSATFPLRDWNICCRHEKLPTFTNKGNQLTGKPVDL